jgi:hypothetical protein
MAGRYSERRLGAPCGRNAPSRFTAGRAGYFTPDSRLFLAYNALSASLTTNSLLGAGVLAAGAPSDFFA